MPHHTHRRVRHSYSPNEVHDLGRQNSNKKLARAQHRRDLTDMRAWYDTMPAAWRRLWKVSFSRLNDHSVMTIKRKE